MRIFTQLLILTTITACGKDDGATESAPATLDAEMQGIWESNECEDLGDEMFTIRRTVVEGERIITYVAVSESHDCSDPYMLLIGVDNFSLGEAYGSGTAIDYECKDKLMAPLTEKTRDGMNQREFYGYTDWEPNTAKTVLDRTADGDDDSRITCDDADLYDIIHIENGRLRSGDIAEDEIIRDEADRPKTLRTNHFYTKIDKLPFEISLPE